MNILIAGIGSFDDSDTVGWELIDRLESNFSLGAYSGNIKSVIKCRLPIDMLSYLTGIDKLIVIEAVKSSSSEADYFRYDYPMDLSTLARHCAKHSPHNVSILTVLSLANQLKILPRQVIFFGVPAIYDRHPEMPDSLIHSIKEELS